MVNVLNVGLETELSNEILKRTHVLISKVSRTDFGIYYLPNFEACLWERRFKVRKPRYFIYIESSRTTVEITKETRDFLLKMEKFSDCILPSVGKLDLFKIINIVK